MFRRFLKGFLATYLIAWMFLKFSSLFMSIAFDREFPIEAYIWAFFVSLALGLINAIPDDKSQRKNSKIDSKECGEHGYHANYLGSVARRQVSRGADQHSAGLPRLPCAVSSSNSNLRNQQRATRSRDL